MPTVHFERLQALGTYVDPSSKRRSSPNCREFVIMPDHFHLLITVGAEMTVEKAIQFIKGGFAFRAGRELGFRAPVWQKGFSEVRVTSAEALPGIRAYVQSNPVKRFLAKAPADYPYSSAPLRHR